MKKIILTLAAVMCACAAVSAQSWLNSVADSRNWAVGGRIGSGLHAQAEYTFRNDNYLEGRFGLSWCNDNAAVMADLELLYNWHLCTMDWTPDAGRWFFDAGCGVVIGGRSHYAYFGFAGSAKFGIALRNVPIKIAVDWTPYLGPGISYGLIEPVFTMQDVIDPTTQQPALDSEGNVLQALVQTGERRFTRSSFNKYGLANFGVSCVYCF